jgi:hypothetical protein
MTDDLSTWKLTELAARFADLEGRECHDVAAKYWDELERRQAIADATAEQARRAEQLKALLVRCLPALDDHYTSDEGTDPTLRAALEAALNKE